MKLYLAGSWRTVKEQVRKVVAVDKFRDNRNNVIMCHEVFQPREEKGKGES